jgi:hypothetical protein
VSSATVRCPSIPSKDAVPSSEDKMAKDGSRGLRFAIWLACSGLASVSSLLTASPARACSLIEPPQPVPASANPSDRVPPVLRSARLDVRRATEPGSAEDGDCGAIGHYTVHVEVTDDVSRPEDLAYLLELVEGTLPFELPGEPVRAKFDRRAGEMSSWFVDDGEAFDAVVAVTMVDEAGNVSEPVAVNASGDAVGCGCALPAGRPGTAAATFAAATLLFLRRARRLLR